MATKKLYVGNLPFSCTDDKLRREFEKYGEVASARIAIDQATGRSRGFGFVEMLDDEAANLAIEKLNKTDFEGRILTVNEARARPNNGNTGGGNRSRSNRSYGG